jgi:hypothetical protein
VVVDEVEDFDLSGVSEEPLGGVGLPKLVGQLSLEADEGSLGPFVGLGRDQALALEDAPDGDPRRSLVDAPARWWRIVWGPASSPAAESSARSSRIASTTLWST